MKIADKYIAGILFLLLASLPIGIWAIFLFVGNPPNASPLDALPFTFSAENEYRNFFLWLAASVVVSAGLPFFWFLARSVSLSLVLFVSLLSIIQAVGYIYWSQWAVSGLSLLPIYWVYRTYKTKPNPLFQPTP